MRPGLQFRSDEASSPTARPLAIRAGGLDVAYPGQAGVHKVLARLDIEVAEGEFLTIIGPSGCGKSTLLRVIADLLDPAAGLIEVFGERPRAAAPGRRVRLSGSDSAALANGR